MEGQIKHKEWFIQHYIPEHVKLILIGHSVGAYIVLELLKRVQNYEIMKTILLFPTIERMALSPKGTVVTPILRYLRWLAVPPMLLLSFVPEQVQEQVIRWYFKGRDIHESAVKATVHLCDKVVAQNLLYMANDEMQKVTTPDIENIQRNLHRVMFYYGIDDHWCPVSFYQDMKELFPKGDIFLCDEGFEHAFVLEHGPPMARKLAKYLEAYLSDCVGSDSLDRATCMEDCKLLS